MQAKILYVIRLLVLSYHKYICEAVKIKQPNKIDLINGGYIGGHLSETTFPTLFVVLNYLAIKT